MVSDFKRENVYYIRRKLSKFSYLNHDSDAISCIY